MTTPKLLALTLMLAPAAVAQEILQTIPRPQGGVQPFRFGTSLDGVGDVNADGVPDLVVTADGNLSQWVYLISGANGAELWSVIVSGEDSAGIATALDDVDGDGIRDVAFASEDSSCNANPGLTCGRVVVLSGVDGSQIYEIEGGNTVGAFGVSIDGIGDIDGDGAGDFVVGDNRDDVNATNTGSAFVYSGADGTLIWQVVGDGSFFALGTHVAGAGDADDDGVPDFLASNLTAVRLYSGATGQMLYEVPATIASTATIIPAKVLAAVGDVDNDTNDDFAVGSTGTTNGTLRIHSGVNGSVMWELDGPHVGARLGWDVDGIADQNGDGHPDVLVNARSQYNSFGGRGAVHVLSGADGSLIYRYHQVGPGALDYGFSVASVGDLNGDGWDDVGLSTIGDGKGSVTIFSGDQDCNGNLVFDWVDTLWLGEPDVDGDNVPDSCEAPLGGTPYCTAKLTSDGCLPEIDGIGTPSATAGSDYFVTARNLTTGTNGLLFFGYGRFAVPFLGGTLCVQPPVRRTGVVQNSGLFGVPCFGFFNRDFNNLISQGIDPGLVAGATVNLQYWFRDNPDLLYGTGLTNGWEIVIGP